MYAVLFCRFIINENVTDRIGLFAVFDGHGSDYVVNLVHAHVRENLIRKIQKAVQLQPVAIPDLQIFFNCKPNYQYFKIKPVINVSEKDPKFLKFYNIAISCLANLSCTMQTPGFQERLQEQLVSNINKVYEIEKNYDAMCYLENGEINYQKMLIDELLLVEYFSLTLTRELVSVENMF